MRRINSLALIALAASIVLAAVPAAAMTAEEVIRKHVAAKGGSNWDELRSIKATGTFTAFSKVSPFTMVKTRDGKFFLDHSQNERTVIIGWDGEQAWWDNHWMQEGAQPLSGVNLAAVSREFDFATPFFDHAKRGYKVKLIGETEIEGIPAIGLELDRGDESKETWYLDPETYLEIARQSPGSDFGRPMEQLTFFDDFREVEGVKIPFLTETQWYTRDRVMRIEKLEANVAVDEAMFAMPAPPGMGELRPLIGKWDVKVETRQQPGAPWQESQRTTEITGLMGGALLEERYESGGNEIVWTLSYDQFEKLHRMTVITEQTRHMDVREGSFDAEAGKLPLSNVDTGTTWSGFGMTFHTRSTFHEITGDGFKLDVEISSDGGQNWFTALKQTYTRKTD